MARQRSLPKGQRKARKVRTKIPVDIAAKVLFVSDRTCCVCRTPGKLIQIHHLDEDPSNHDVRNLCVLCVDCHNLTILRGGFHRFSVLNRSCYTVTIGFNSSPNLDPNGTQVWGHKPDERLLELATAKAEILRENHQHELLASHYNAIGHGELRDKYVRKALTSLLNS